MKYAQIINHKESEINIHPYVDQYGYGKRIPTKHMIKIPESKHWLRVRMVFNSNCPCYYVSIKDNNFICVDYLDLIKFIDR